MSAAEEGAAKVSDSRRHRLSGSQLGSLIAGVFGLIYLEANSGSLPAPVPAALRIAAAVALVGLVVLLLGRRRPHATTGQPGGSGFGAEYWSVVAGEAAAILAGSIILTTVFNLPHGRGRVGLARDRLVRPGGRRRGGSRRRHCGDRRHGRYRTRSAAARLRLLGSS